MSARGSGSEGKGWFRYPPVRCLLCGRDVAPAEDKEKHVTACLQTGKGGPVECQLFLAQDRLSVFSLLFLAHPAATFGDLDRELRGFWMECCGHCTQFTMLTDPKPGQMPSCMTEWDPADTSETCMISSRFDKPYDREVVWFDQEQLRLMSRMSERGVVAMYDYDWGTTSTVAIRACAKVVVPRLTALRLFSGTSGGDQHPLVLVARNELPEIPCSACKWPISKYVHYSDEMVCDKDPDMFWCSLNCARKHADDYAVMRLWNSPRSGVCGYDGPDGWLDESWWPDRKKKKQAKRSFGKKKQAAGRKKGAAGIAGQGGKRAASRATAAKAATGGIGKKAVASKGPRGRTKAAATKAAKGAPKRSAAAGKLKAPASKKKKAAA